MTLEGHVENGQIVLHGDVRLAEGIKVRVELLTTDPQTTVASESTAQEPQSLYERMKPFIGAIDDLPSDFAINHDHYIHGQPKRQ